MITHTWNIIFHVVGWLSAINLMLVATYLIFGSNYLLPFVSLIDNAEFDIMIKDMFYNKNITSRTESFSFIANNQWSVNCRSYRDFEVNGVCSSWISIQQKIKFFRELNKFRKSGGFIEIDKKIAEMKSKKRDGFGGIPSYADMIRSR